MTLKEVAKIAGVSVSTVSRVINSTDNNFASVQVRNRVWEAVQKTGYVADQNARALRAKGLAEQSTPKNIACFLELTRRDDENPFFAEMVRAFEQQALKMGCHVPHVFSFFDPDNEAIMRRMLDINAQGAVVMGRFDKVPIVHSLKKHYKHIVFIGLNEVSDEYDRILCSGYEAGLSAVEHLFSLGHREIAFVGETKKEPRYDAYCDYLSTHGIATNERLIGSCDKNGSEGFEALSRVMKSAAPTAVLCANDITAIAVLDYCRAHNIKVPKDLSVISVDDVQKAATVSPMLTTVRLPKDEMGRYGAKILIERINKEHTVPMKIIFPHRLIQRETTAVLRNI